MLRGLTGLSRLGGTTTPALSSGQAVGDYERGRPSYPAEAVDWMLRRAGSVADVVDVGAGTGTFTKALVEPVSA